MRRRLEPRGPGSWSERRGDAALDRRTSRVEEVGHAKGDGPGEGLLARGGLEVRPDHGPAFADEREAVIAP
jgi:hypothetical protein